MPQQDAPRRTVALTLAAGLSLMWTGTPHAADDPIAATRARWGDTAQQIADNTAVVHRMAFNAQGRAWPAVGTFQGQISAWFGYLEEARALTEQPLKIVDEKTIAAREHRAEYLYGDEGQLLFALVLDPERVPLRIYWDDGRPIRIQVGSAVLDSLDGEQLALAADVHARGAALAAQARQLRVLEGDWTSFSQHTWPAQ